MLSFSVCQLLIKRWTIRLSSWIWGQVSSGKHQSLKVPTFSSRFWSKHHNKRHLCVFPKMLKRYPSTGQDSSEMINRWVQTPSSPFNATKKQAPKMAQFSFSKVEGSGSTLHHNNTLRSKRLTFTGYSTLLNPKKIVPILSLASVPCFFKPWSFALLGKLSLDDFLLQPEMKTFYVNMELRKLHTSF